MYLNLILPMVAFSVPSLLLCTRECSGQESAPAARGGNATLPSKSMPRFTSAGEDLIPDQRDQQARSIAVKIIEERDRAIFQYDARTILSNYGADAILFDIPKEKVPHHGNVGRDKIQDFWAAFARNHQHARTRPRIAYLQYINKDVMNVMFNWDLDEKQNAYVNMIINNDNGIWRIVSEYIVHRED